MIFPWPRVFQHMKGLEFPVGNAIDVGISTGNCSWLVAWLGRDVRCPSMFAIEKFISVLLSASCPNSGRHSFTEMGTQGNQILTIFLLGAGFVGFLFRASTYTPVEDRAKFEAAYITWVVSFCACVLFLLWTCCLRINPRGQIHCHKWSPATMWNWKLLKVRTCEIWWKIENQQLYQKPSIILPE